MDDKDKTLSFDHLDIDEVDLEKERAQAAGLDDNAPAASAAEGDEDSYPAEVGKTQVFSGGSLKNRPAAPPKPPKSAEQLAWEKAKKEHFNSYVWGPWLKPIVALVSICIVTSLLLGLTNQMTQPIIAENARLAAEQARKDLLPAADGFEEIEVPEGAANVTAVYRATNGTGWVVEAYATGYGGKVPAMVAFDASGTIVGVVFLENSETVGLGQKVRTRAFQDQFAGRAGQPLSLGDIDKITSATVSTGAAIGAVNAAIEAYNILAGGSVANMSPEEVLEYLLPDATLTAITLAAEGVQPQAWRSDAGDYIIFGEAQGVHSLVVAAVAMNSDGVILNVWFDTSDETEGIGTPVGTNAAFAESFVGQASPVQVDAIADATLTSDAVAAAVNSALAALPAAKEAA